jgi:hypothetical protein
MTLANDMNAWYKERTNTHIKRVQKYAYLITDFFPEFQELRKIVKKHDQSKFEDPERIPYIFIT